MCIRPQCQPDFMIHIAFPSKSIPDKRQLDSLVKNPTFTFAIIAPCNHIAPHLPQKRPRNPEISEALFSVIFPTNTL